MIEYEAIGSLLVLVGKSRSPDSMLALLTGRENERAKQQIMTKAHF